MQELLLAVARGLVEDKEAVKVTVDEPREDGTIVYHLSVAEGDMGRVIGKQGRIAKAIRVVMRAAAVRSMKRSLLRSTEHPTGPLPLRQGAFLLEEKTMQQYLEAGKVVTTHGVRGEMKLELWCDGVDFLKKAGRLFPSAQGGRAYKITSIRPQGQMALLQLEGVNDMDAAPRTAGTGVLL